MKIKDDFELKVDNLPFIDIMNDERCGKLEYARKNLKKKEKEEEKEKEIKRYKKPKKNKVEEDDFGYGNGDYNNEDGFQFDN